jgi:1-deoxy-D-xylulose 5-phosphate reductoisomerase
VVSNNTEVLHGAEALNTIAAHDKTDYVMAAIVCIFCQLV